MWSFNSMHIFICIFCIYIHVRADDICGQEYKVPKWEPEDTEKPAYVRLGIVPEVAEGKIPEITGALEIQLEDVQESFTLTLLANPFIENRNDCLPATTVSRSYRNLRKFHQSYRIDEHYNTSNSICLGNIFTGCYYVEMENAEGKKWLWDPVFLDTSYHYYDTMLKCKSFQTKPETYGGSRQLNLDLEIPLTCLRVQCMLFELDEETNITKHHLDAGKIQATQNCSIIYQGNGVAPGVECWRKDTGPILYATEAVKKGEGWETFITWDHLKEGEEGASYYTLFVEYNHSCTMNRSDLLTWQPVIRIGTLSHGFKNQTNIIHVLKDSDVFNSSIASTLYVLLSVSVTAILVYWMAKYAKILLYKHNARNDLLVQSPDIVQLHNQKEFNNILLIYAKDSPLFMKAMEALKERLQQTCHLPVHDLYSVDEWNTITKLGATGWVEDLLRAGSKVVWVDTPRFRSILKNSKLDKNEEKQNITIDFRDEAIPYAVSLATDLYQNVTTQYRCHFVIRLEGFLVEDGNDDPLLVVSPHARYRIPEHLNFLCEHLAR